MDRSNRIAQRGVSLVDAAVTLAIASIVAASAAPAMDTLRQRARVESVAALLETTIHQARSEAVASNRNVRLGFESDPQSSCWVVHTGPAGSCRCLAIESEPVCRDGARSLNWSRFNAGQGVHVTSNASSLGFDPVTGTVTPTATMAVDGGAGHGIHVVVNIMGRVRSCATGGPIAGQPRCGPP